MTAITPSNHLEMHPRCAKAKRNSMERFYETADGRQDFQMLFDRAWETVYMDVDTSRGLDAYEADFAKEMSDDAAMAFTDGTLED